MVLALNPEPKANCVCWVWLCGWYCWFKKSKFDVEFICFCVGGGWGINLKWLVGNYLGVWTILGSFILRTSKLFWFFIYLNGEHEGCCPIPITSTWANLHGQFTIY